MVELPWLSYQSFIYKNGLHNVKISLASIIVGETSRDARSPIKLSYNEKRVYLPDLFSHSLSLILSHHLLNLCVTFCSDVWTLSSELLVLAVVGLGMQWRTGAWRSPECSLTYSTLSHGIGTYQQYQAWRFHWGCQYSISRGRWCGASTLTTCSAKWNTSRACQL